MPGCVVTGTAERSYPSSEVRSRPRGVPPRPKSGGATRGVTPRPKSGSGRRGATSLLRSGGAADLCFPTSEVRWGGREELPRVRGQGRMPEGATPGPQARGQGRLPGGATTRPRSRGCVGTGGPRGATSYSRSGEATLSKVRSSPAALCWSNHEETPYV